MNLFLDTSDLSISSNEIKAEIISQKSKGQGCKGQGQPDGLTDEF